MVDDQIEHGLYWRLVMSSGFSVAAVSLTAIISAATLISRRVSAYGVTSRPSEVARITSVSSKAPLGKAVLHRQTTSFARLNNLVQNRSQAADYGLAIADNAVAFNAARDARVTVNHERLVANGDVSPAVVVNLDINEALGEVTIVEVQVSRGRGEAGLSEKLAAVSSPDFDGGFPRWLC